jgi:hypothetical protein
MFFKWGMDMLSNITLASNAQCMKFKMLYDNYKKKKPLIRSNQPIIPFYSYDQNSRTIEYDSDEEEMSMKLQHYSKTHSQNFLIKMN